MTDNNAAESGSHRPDLDKLDTAEDHKEVSDEQLEQPHSKPGQQSDFKTAEIVEETITLFQQATVAAYVKRTIALFALVGLGFGLAGYLFISIMLEGGGLIDVTIGYLLAMVVLLCVTFLGAALAAAIATQARTTLNRSLVETCVVCGASCYAGILGMTVISIVLIRSAFPPIVASELDLVGLFALSVLTSVPAALVAAGVVWVDRRYLGTLDRPLE